MSIPRIVESKTVTTPPPPAKLETRHKVSHLDRRLKLKSKQARLITSSYSDHKRPDGLDYTR